MGVLAPGLFAEEVKLPNVAGAFYPAGATELSQTIDTFLAKANPEPQKGDIFGLIVPHAGYGYSGQVAAYSYKLIKAKPYKTVVVIGTSHYYPFQGVSVYPEGSFRTPLGDLEIDKEFTQNLLGEDNEIFFDDRAFEIKNSSGNAPGEHSVEVQLPFLQKVLTNFKIVPIVMGDCPLSICQKLAGLLKKAIGDRRDVLLVISTDMYHGYDYKEAESVDSSTLAYLKNMDAEGLYYGLRDGKLQLCGGFGAVTALILSKELGHDQLKVLNYTNSANVTGKKIAGVWTVGYSSCAIDQETPRHIGAAEVTLSAEGANNMLTKEQRKKLLNIARNSIKYHLENGKKLQIAETDPVLLEKMGAFVTLHEKGELRGCIGNMVGNQPLYLTIRDMAVEAAVGDPRFQPVTLSDLKDIEIEISALSPLKKIDSAQEIEMGVHGVLVRRGFQSGVFLPQVATETDWSKEEFLSNLCAHKAGLSADAWKDKATEIYIFTAEVFSEKNY